MRDNPEPLALPDPAPPPAPTPFPLIAAVAPLAAAAVLWAVTHSPYVLVFAILSPVIAVASVGDRAIQNRRARRRSRRERRAAVTRLTTAVAEAHDEERAELDHEFRRAAHGAVPSGSFRWHPVQRSGTRVAVGLGAVPSSRPLEGTAENDAERELCRVAAVVADAPVTVEVASGLGVVAPRQLAQALARTVLAALALRLPPGQAHLVAVPRSDDWRWADELAHRRPPGADGATTIAVHEAGQPPVSADALITVTTDAALLPPRIETVLEFCSDHAWRLTVAGSDSGVRRLRPDLLSRAEARSISALIDGAVAQLGLFRGEQLPDSVALSELEPPRGVGLEGALGRSAHGDVRVDLVADGPHAVVGGTTGSGKSELLITWVCSLARQRSCDEVTFLLVDFKGGATFQPLTALPHCVGVVTDLDAATAKRAVESLQAELSRRERILAEHQVSNIAHLPAGTMPRLVIVVDEFASMIATFADFHDLFSDIAARGRSLGIHLILCTQRPVGVVRDALMANCPLRLSLRVTSASDSQAIVGTDQAAQLPADAPGRCILSLGGQTTRLQVATTDDDEIAAAASRYSGGPPPRRPWLDPLAPQIELDSLQSRSGLITLGVEDRPRQQRQVTSYYDPLGHGSLLAIGARRSGKTNLVDLVAAQWPRVRLVGRHPEQAWDAVAEVCELSTAARAQPEPLLLVLDDLDALIAAIPERRQPLLTERLVTILREGPAQEILVVAAAARVTSTVRSLLPLFGRRLILRVSDRQEHVLLDADKDLWSPSAPPGSAVSEGHRLQLARSPSPAPIPEHAPSPVSFVDGAVYLLVSRRPARRRQELMECTPSVQVELLDRTGRAASEGVSISSGCGARVIVADPDTWQGRFSFLTEQRERATLLFDGCLESDVRMLARGAEAPPITFGAQRVLALTPDGGWERLVWPSVRAVRPDEAGADGEMAE